MARLITSLCVSLSLVLSAAVLLGAGPLYLIDSAKVPRVRLAWTTEAGERVDVSVDRPYGSKYDRTHMVGNVDTFVAIGGTRIDKGCGHPKGLLVRVGFYKQDKDALFFEGLPGDGTLHIELRNVKANQPGRVIPHTTIQHLQYTREDIEACGLGREGQDQFNTRHPRESLLGQLTETNTRFGALDGEEGHGSVEFVREDDGTLTVKADVPYELLRHTKDPWVRPEPGLFLEPYHFHIEFELLPEGVEPLPLSRPAAGESKVQ